MQLPIEKGSQTKWFGSTLNLLMVSFFFLVWFVSSRRHFVFTIRFLLVRLIFFFLGGLGVSFFFVLLEAAALLVRSLLIAAGVEFSLFFSLSLSLSHSLHIFWLLLLLLLLLMLFRFSSFLSLSLSLFSFALGPFFRGLLFCFIFFRTKEFLQLIRWPESAIKKSNSISRERLFFF